MSLLRRPPAPGIRSDALGRVRASLPSLSPAERRVAERVLEHPEEVIALTIGEFAGLSGVAQPTVSRMARNVGFDGYPAMRLGIAHEFAGLARTSTGPASEIDHAAAQWSNVESDASLPEIAALLRGASTVEIWVSPVLDFAAALLETELRGMSIPAARSVAFTHWRARIQGAGPGAVVILLSDEGDQVPWQDAITLAQEAGAKTISITRSPTRAENRNTDLQLVLPDQGRTEVTGLLAVDAIVQAVSALTTIGGPPGPASPWRAWRHQRRIVLETRVQPVTGIVLHHGDDAIDRTVIIFFNGMHSTKEGALPGVRFGEGELVAPALVASLLNAGHVVVLVDNPAHGDRKRAWEEPEALIAADFTRRRPRFLGQSRTVASDLVDGLVGLGVAHSPEAIGVVGQSWGGLQALLSLAGDERLSFAVGIMPLASSTDLEPFIEFSTAAGAADGLLSGEDMRAVAMRPVLLIGGSDDPIASDANLDLLAADLRAEAEPSKADITHVTLQGSTHAFDPRLNDVMAKWIQRRHAPGAA